MVITLFRPFPIQHLGQHKPLGAGYPRGHPRGFVIPQEVRGSRLGQYAGERASDNTFLGNPDGYCHPDLRARPAAGRDRMDT